MILGKGYPVESDPLASIVYGNAEYSKSIDTATSNNDEVIEIMSTAAAGSSEVSGCGDINGDGFGDACGISQSIFIFFGG